MAALSADNWGPQLSLPSGYPSLHCKPTSAVLVGCAGIAVVGGALALCNSDVRLALRVICDGASRMVGDAVLHRAEAGVIPLDEESLKKYLDENVENGPWAITQLHHTGGLASRYFSGKGPNDRQVFIKISAASSPLRLLESALGVGPKEVEFYQSVLPAGLCAVDIPVSSTNCAANLGIQIPRCLVSQRSPCGSRYIIVLENLEAQSGVRLGRVGDLLPPEAMERCLVSLARLHARYYGKAGAIPSRYHKANVTFFDLMKRLSLPKALKSGYVHKGTHVDRACAAVIRLGGTSPIIDRVNAITGGVNGEGRSLTHSDVHSGNTYFNADGQPGLLDWQTYHYGSPVLDVCNLLITSLSLEDFKSHHEDLICSYVATLQSERVTDISAASVHEALPLVGAMIVVSYAMVASFGVPDHLKDEFTARWNDFGQLAEALRIGTAAESVL